jgi:hypothetical protein
MRVFLLKIISHFNTSILFFYLYSVVVGYLDIMTNYIMYSGIDVRLAVECATYLYLLFNLMLAIIPNLKWASIVIVLYGCVSTFFVSPDALPVKWFFWCPIGIFIAVINLISVHIILTKCKKEVDSVSSRIIFVIPIVIPLCFYFLAVICNATWGWLIKITVEALKWTGLSTVFIFVLNMLIGISKIDGIINRLPAKLLILLLLALIFSEFFLMIF